MANSKLQLCSVHHIGGSGAHERFTYDFVVDGRSLADALGVSKFGLVGCFDAMENKRNTHAARALLLKEPPDVPPDRVMLYVCPECAHLGCGAFTARVINSGDEFVWADFRYENDYDSEMTQSLQGIGPFRFAAADYRSVLGNVAASV